MKIRTMKQAHAEAVRLYGKKAAVGDKGPSHPYVFVSTKGNRLRQHRYKVGRGFFGIAFEVLGEGDSWDEAFAEALLHENRYAADAARAKAERESRDFVCLENEGRCRRKQLLDRASEKAWGAHEKAKKRCGEGSNAEWKAWRAAQKAGEESAIGRTWLCPIHDGHDAFDAVLAPAMKDLWAAREELGWKEEVRRQNAMAAAINAGPPSMGLGCPPGEDFEDQDPDGGAL